jgi:hypothetical protein
MLKMKQLTLLMLAMAIPGAAQAQSNPFMGRWDITVTAGKDTYPDWMELTQKDGKLDAFIQPRSGGARHWDTVKLEGGKLIVTMDGGRGPASVWELTSKGDRFSGEVKRGGTVSAQLEGVRSPALNRPMPTAWTSPEPLFNGKDLTGWEPMGAAASHWVAKDGELLNESKGANLKTTRKFDDFKLHIEYNCP